MKNTLAYNGVELSKFLPGLEITENEKHASLKWY